MGSCEDLQCKMNASVGVGLMGWDCQGIWSCEIRIQALDLDNGRISIYKRGIIWIVRE